MVLINLIGKESGLILSYVVVFFRYSGRGLFLDPPTVFYNNEKCNLHVPGALAYTELKNSGAGME